MRHTSRSIASPELIAALVSLALGVSAVRGEAVFADNFDDGDLSDWTASGTGTWSADNAARPNAAVHAATGTAGRIEHALGLNGDTWSVEFDAGWQWGSANAGVFLSVWLLDDEDNGYKARVIQDGNLSVHRVDAGVLTNIAGPANIGKLAGGPLTSFRLTRSAEGVLAFDFSPGDRWLNAVSITDTTHTAFTRVRLQEDTGKGNAIFDNIVVADTPSSKKHREMTAAEHQALLPVDVAQFYIEPDKPAELVFCMVKTPSFFFNGSLPYYITDYRDGYVASGQARWNCGVIKLPVTLRQGFYELTFPTTGQSFGVQAIPAAEGEPDPFFGIDSAMSWFIKPERHLRENLVRVLKRNGICSARGRVSWGGLEPEKGKWVWDGECQYETLRELYARYGIQLLDMCEVTPKWNDPDGGGGTKSFLQNLTETVRSWQTISGRWEGLWAGFEIWNEPDNNSFFNGGAYLNRGIPADQYAQFAKAISYAFHRTGVKTPLIGGCFSISVLGAHFATTPSAYHRLAALNGLLDCVDGVSFHSYSPPPAIQGQVAGMRAWLEKNGKASMPIYLTESGVVPWSDGKTLLPQTAGLAMKMIEAKACGVARFYAFVYPPLPGGKDWRFGLTNYNGSPRRLMAGLVQAVHALSGRPYIGDLRGANPSVKLARVFGGHDEAVLVLFTGKTNPGQVVKLDLPVQRIEGADGRLLKSASDGGVPIPDGIAYVYVDKHKIELRLVKDTPAMRLWKLAQQSPPKCPTPSPIILQPRLDKKFFPPTYTGYRVAPDAPAHRLPVAIEVFNLSDAEQKLELALANPNLGKAARPLAHASVSVPARSSRPVVLRVDATKGYRPGRKQTLWITARSDGVKNISPLVMDLKRELHLKRMMRYFASSSPLPITELTRWSKGNKSDARFSRTEEGCWRMDAKSDATARFRLPEAVKLAKADGFVIRAKCLQNAKVWLSVLDAAGHSVFHYPRTVFLASDKTYQPSETCLHPDGEWHSVYVPLAFLKALGGRQGLPRFERIQLGLKNLSGKKNALILSDLLIVQEK